MIIPVRCVTCGKVLADKFRHYQRRCEDLHAKDPKAPADPADRADPKDSTAAARVLDEMKITRICCRRHMLTNVDAMHRI